MHETWYLKVLTNILHFKLFWKTYCKKSCISQECSKRTDYRCRLIADESHSFGWLRYRCESGRCRSVLFFLTFDKDQFGDIFASKTIDSIVTHSFKMCMDENQQPPVFHPAGEVPIYDVKNLLYLAREHRDFCEQIMNWNTVDHITPEVQDDWFMFAISCGYY